jgi:hypothetical protein
MHLTKKGKKIDIQVLEVLAIVLALHFHTVLIKVSSGVLGLHLVQVF